MSEWLVDGFNVLHVGLGGRTQPDWWNAAGRKRVLDCALRLVAQGERVRVVFDGSRPAEPDEGSPAGLAVVFAPSADRYLLRAIREAEDPAALALVTADRPVAERARKLGARVVAPQEFLARCGPAQAAEPA